MLKRFFRRVRKKWQVLKRRRKQRLVTCAWCKLQIEQGSEVTAYSPAKIEDLSSLLTEGVKMFRLSKNPTDPPVLIGCTRKDCISNKDGIIIAGILKKGGKIELKSPIPRRYLFFKQE